MPRDNKNQIETDKTVNRNNYALPTDGIVFCCFNNNFKISPKEFDIWMEKNSRKINPTKIYPEKNKIIVEGKSNCEFLGMGLKIGAGNEGFVDDAEL